MADINFPIDSCVGPSSAEAGRLVYTTGTTSDGDVTLAQSNMSVDPEGFITSPSSKIRIKNAIDIVTAETNQVVNANTTITQVDLTKGANITLNQSSSTMIQFLPGGLPTEGIRLFGIERIKDATSTARTLEFITAPPTQTWLKEGGLSLLLTQNPNGEDYIYGWVDSAANVVTRMPSLNFLPSSIAGEFAEMNSPNYIPFFARPNRGYRKIPIQRVSGVEAGMMISTMADGTLNACGLKTDGVESFTAMMEMYMLGMARKNIRHVFKDSAPTLTIDLYNEDFVSLNHNSDISEIRILPGDPDYCTCCFVWRVKDATATPRSIFFDPTVFDWDMDPILTQTSGGCDLIFIMSAGGVNWLSVFNYFA